MLDLTESLEQRSELYMLLEESCLWSSQLESINKVLEKTIFKVKYVKKLLVIKGIKLLQSQDSLLKLAILDALIRPNGFRSM